MEGEAKQRCSVLFLKFLLLRRIFIGSLDPKAHTGDICAAARVERFDRGQSKHHERTVLGGNTVPPFEESIRVTRGRPGEAQPALLLAMASSDEMNDVKPPVVRYDPF